MPYRAIIAAMLAFACVFACAGCSPVSKAEFESDVAQVDAKSAEQSVPKSYTIKRVDGKAKWKRTPQMDIDNAQWLDAGGIAAHAQLCYDDEALYVHMWAEESDVLATYRKSDPVPDTYQDSCLEFFLAPVEGDERYVNFEFNANAAVRTEIGAERTERVALVPSGDTYSAKAKTTDEGWDLKFKLPYSFLRTLYPDFEAQSGVQMHGNFYKCGDNTAQKHYLTWSRVGSDTPDFHRPDSFGDLVFE